MAAANILVVDSDEGFGHMLTEGLENSGHYTAKCVHTGADALQAVVEQPFDLVIIDVALSDMSPITLIQAIREAKNGMRIMMIPLIGQSLPDSISNLNINGILTKPFFVGDLPDLVDQAIGRRRMPNLRQAAPPPSQAKTDEPEESSSGEAEPLATERVEEATEEESLGFLGQDVPVLTIAPVPQETISFLRANEAEILRLLDDLNREVRAEAILLIAGVELIAQAGMLSRTQCQELSALVAQSSQAASHAAKFLGEAAGRFAQSLHEGREYRLYSLTLGEGILLSLALSSNVPLGMIRHQCRQIGEQLAKFII